MTSKERAALRAQANTLQALFQVGKEGVTPAVAAQALESFNTRELLKGKVLLENCPQSPREAAEALAAMTGSEVVQVVGGSMVFYKENPELRAKQAEEAKKAKKAARPAQRAAKPAPRAAFRSSERKKK